MNPDYERAKVFSRRAMILGGGKAVLLSALVARMYYLQVLESKKYATLADENRINLRLVPPPRGRILDRFGVPLAVNRQSYRVDIVAERASDVSRTLAALDSILPLSPHEKKRIMRTIRRKRGFVPITIRENLSWEDVSRIAVNAPDLPGILIQEGRSRDYPFGPAAAHLVGYVAAVSSAEETGDPLLRLPDFRIGKNGAERVYDLMLRGKPGSSQFEVNAHGRSIKELSRKEATAGKDLALTIDMGLQKFAATRLGDQSAVVVVIDTRGGEIMALASSPSFEPAAFHDGLDRRTWRTWRNDPRKPLIDKATSGQYAPGSVFKMCVALAALEAGAITPDHRVTCRGYIDLGSARFHCWKRGGHGNLDLRGGIKHSCDVYFYDVARRVGVDKIAAMARRLGFGDITGIDLTNEKPGFIPTRAWKLATLGEPWQEGETLVSGIGQGYILTTPLQLAVYVARLASGGKAVLPHVARDVMSGDGIRPRPAAKFKSLGLAKKNLAVVLDAMNAVVNEPGGTARRSRLPDTEARMGGKTGTAQVRRITRSERARGVRKNKDLPWKQRDHALFVGFAPVSEPRYAVAVVVEHGGGGSRAAGPIARDVMAETLKRDPLKARGKNVADGKPLAREG